MQLVVLHKVKVISNWMKCLRFAIGSSFSGDSAFALMFVLYNPVSRKDIANKQQQFNQKLADELLPLHQAYIGKSRFSLYGIKVIWIYFKFAVEHFFGEDCSPVSVLAALDEPHAAFAKHVARLNMLIKNGEEKRGNKSPSLLRKMQTFWSRRNKVLPEPVAQDVESDAPQQFINKFVSKRDFIVKNFDEDTRTTVITLLLLDRVADFGEDGACQHYLGKLVDDGAACRAAMRSIFDALEELSQRAAAEDTSGGCWWHMRSWLLARVFGPDMVKSINWFHRLDNGQQNELMKSHDFPSADSIYFSITTADDMVTQSPTLSTVEHKNPALYTTGLKSPALEERNLGSAQLYRQQHVADSTLQPIGPSSPAVEEGASQSSLSQNPQANSLRFLDLETQLAELKASDSKLRALNTELRASNTELRASNTELKAQADAFRDEILELKKSLVAANPLQSPNVS